MSSVKEWRTGVCFGVNRDPKAGSDAATDGAKALAYFAHQYRPKNQTSFNGYILLMDCGEEGLEMILGKVDGEVSRTEIRIQERVWLSFGSYCQRVASLAAGASAPLAQKVQRHLEDSNELELLRDAFGCYPQLCDILKQPDLVWLSTDSGASVTYQQLYKVYQPLEQLVKQKLEQMIQRIKADTGKDLCAPEAALGEDFKILFVSDCGVSAMVEHQAEEIFGLYADKNLDGRTKDMPQATRHQSVSKGNECLRSGQAILLQAAPWRAGLEAGNGASQICMYTCGPMEIVGQPYFIRYDSKGEDTPTNRAVFSKLKGCIRDICLTLPDGTQCRKALSTHCELSDMEWCNVGFSVGSDGALFLHTEPSELLNRTGTAARDVVFFD